MKALIQRICFLVAITVVPAWAIAQSNLTGRVIDEKGGPVIGATVKVKGKQVGTLTDVSGSYRIPVSVGDSILCTSIGFQPKGVLYKTAADLTIRMSEDNKTLGQVLVVGYKSQSRQEITGSVASIKMDKVTETQAAESFESLLQGRIAGVNIQLNSGEPGATPAIIIRGLAAVSRDDASALSEPLYVVDGVPIISKTSNEFSITSTNVLADLNPSDIETVTVLKDASAAAIYGSRAANGVILITTKKGKIGKPQIGFNLRTGINFVPKLLDVAGGAKEREQVLGLYQKYAPYGTFAPAMYTDTTNPFYNNSSDWQGYLYNTSVTQDYSSSIRGAGDFGQYSISLGYMDNKGILFNTGFKRYSTMTSTTFYALNKKLIINNTLAVARTDQGRNQGVLSTGYSTLLPLPDNSIVAGAEVYQPGHINNVNDRVRFSSDATLNLVKDLSFKTSLSLEYLRLMQDSSAMSRRTLKGDVRSGAGENRNLLIQNTLSYAPTFGKHKISLLLGQSAERLESKVTIVNNVASTQSLSQTVNGPVGYAIGRSNYTANSLASFFSRLDYSFDEKYLVGASIRTDGSSKFGAANRWGIFPSASAGWNINKEEIFKDWKWLNNAKIRGSYGLSGTTWNNDYLALGIMDGGSLDQYNSLLQISYGGVSGYTPTWYNGFKNDNLTWVKTSMGNIGLDLSMFNNNVEFIFDAYQKYTKGLLLTTDLPTTSGYNTVYRNAADVLNRGLEFTLNTNIPVGKNFTWNTGLNFAYNQNRVMSLPNGNADIVKVGPQGGQDFGTVIRVGAPLNGFFFYQSQGIYQAESQIPVNPKTGAPLLGLSNKKLAVGDRNFKDQNGDYVINVSDRVYAGDPNPKWTGGWTNDFNYKNFGLNIVSTFVMGRDIVNSTLLDRLRLGKSFAGSSSLPNFDNYSIWQKSGDDAKYPTLNPWISTSQIVNYDSEYVEDGSYFKIKSATLSYNFTKKNIKRLPFDRLRVYCTIDNVITFQKYSGPDAELVSVDGFDISGGYPMRRMLLFGLSIGL